MKPLRLSRRSVLRSAAGVAIALPWLEAMQADRAHAQSTNVARRFISVYQPGGTILAEWLPSGTETAFELSPILAPFAPVRDQLLVLSGLAMQSAVGEQSQSGLAALLTGTPQMASARFAQGPSVDQAIAPLASQGQPYPSLHQAVRWGTGRAYGEAFPTNILAYADDADFTPVVPRIDPQATWESLFGALEPASDDGLQRQRSVLDYLVQRYASIAQRLGVEDRQRLEEHAERIRELELDLAEMSASGARCSAPAVVDTSEYDPAAGLVGDLYGNVKFPETDAAIPKVGKWMMDMLVMAMACDLTSVGTLQWADTEAVYTFPWLDLPETHMYYQNGGGYRPEQLTQICIWYSEQHSYLLQQMAAVEMGGHSLLDESVVFFGSEVQHPATHIKSDMPFLLAGGGGGLKAGRWLAYDGQSHNDLLVTLLNLFGDERQSFGFEEYCSGPLAGLV